MSLFDQYQRRALNNLGGGFPQTPRSATARASVEGLATMLEQAFAGAGLPALEGVGAAASIYVNPATGNDTTGTGSSDTPYASVSRALKDVPIFVRRRIKIILAAGTYGVAFTEQVLALQRWVSDFYAGAVIIEGAAGSLSQTVTLVSAGAHPTNTALTRLNVGAFGFAITANETFVVQTVAGQEFWYAVSAASSPNIDVSTSVAASFTPGEALVVRNLGVQFDEAQLRGAFGAIGVEHLSLRGIRFANGIVEASCCEITGCTFDATMSQAFLRDVEVTSCHVGIADPGGSAFSIVGSGNGTLAGLLFFGATAVGWEFGALTIYDWVHSQAMSGATRGKITAKYGCLLLGISTFPMVFGGLGVCIIVDGGQHVARNNFALTNASRLGVVRNNGLWARDAGTGTGSCTSQAFQLTEASSATGLEAGYSAITSTPAGNDVLVGANGAITWAALPSDDLAQLAGTRQICRAT